RSVPQTRDPECGTPGSRLSLRSAGMTILAFLSVLAVLPAQAQDFKAEWAKLVAEAEKEGALVIHSQPNQAFRNFIQTEFGKAYPKIALTVDALPETQFWARIRTERQADKYLWDMSVRGSST